jgi:hypothetical protein
LDGARFLPNQNHKPQIKIPAMKPSLEPIAKATRQFADARRELAAVVDATNRRMRLIYEDNLAQIRKLLARVTDSRTALEALLLASPELFAQPRTVVVHGVKIGLRKGKGAIDWDDDEQIVRLIKKLFPEQADVLIRTTERPIKNALAELSAADLKRLGVTVEETGDVPVIQPADSAVDKVVKTFFKTSTEELQEAA